MGGGGGAVGPVNTKQLVNRHRGAGGGVCGVGVCSVGPVNTKQLVNRHRGARGGGWGWGCRSCKHKTISNLAQRG